MEVQIQSQVNEQISPEVCWYDVRHKKQEYFRFFLLCAKQMSVDKSYGRFSIKSENTISNKWNDSHQECVG